MRRYDTLERFRLLRPTTIPHAGPRPAQYTVPKNVVMIPMRRKNSLISTLFMGGFLALSLAACDGKPADPYPHPRAESGIPRFPWPPPPASAEFEIPPNRLLASGKPLSDLAEKLERELGRAKYRKWSYSSVPSGFALVAQMEQIKPDGTPSPARWSTNLPSVGDLTLFEIIKALASAPPGYYRVIVFIATDQPWSRSGAKPTGQKAERWLTEGYNKLPAHIGRLPYGPEFTTTAFVYEFRKPSQSADATLVENSEWPAEDHLRKAGISFD